MNKEIERMQNAKEIVSNLSKGIDPLSGKGINENSFMKDETIIKCMSYVADVLDNNIKYLSKPRRYEGKSFSITEDQKNKIELPNDKIGVNEFAKCVNEVIDMNQSRKLSGVMINKQLKKMGILSEEIIEEGKTKTIVNNKSLEYGIETDKRSFRGNEYEMILFNEKGKQFLLDNLEAIMNFEKQESSKIS